MPNLLRTTACILLLGSIADCTTVKEKAKPVYEFMTAAVDDETYIRFTMRINTKAQMIAVRDPTYRRELADHEYAWANDIYRITNAKDATMAVIRRKVEDRLLGSGFRYRAEADWLLKTMYGIIDTRMTVYLFYATPPAQVEMLCQFLRASADGVRQGTEDYRTKPLKPSWPTSRQITSSRPTTQRGR
jgi:hypothetical protein